MRTRRGGTPPLPRSPGGTARQRKQGPCTPPPKTARRPHHGLLVGTPHCRYPRAHPGREHDHRSPPTRSRSAPDAGAGSGRQSAATVPHLSMTSSGSERGEPAPLREQPRQRAEDPLTVREHPVVERKLRVRARGCDVNEGARTGPVAGQRGGCTTLGGHFFFASAPRLAARGLSTEHHRCADQLSLDDPAAAPKFQRSTTMLQR